MTYAPQIEGYEIVDLIIKSFTSGKYIPMGDPDKAAKVIVELAEHPEPPVHLVLGSEAIGRLKQADAARQAELEKWLPVSISTDHDEAQNFFETELGKQLFGSKK